MNESNTAPSLNGFALDNTFWIDRKISNQTFDRNERLQCKHRYWSIPWYREKKYLREGNGNHQGLITGNVLKLVWNVTSLKCCLTFYLVIWRYTSILLHKQQDLQSVLAVCPYRTNYIHKSFEFHQAHSVQEKFRIYLNSNEIIGHWNLYFIKD